MEISTVVAQELNKNQIINKLNDTYDKIDYIDKILYIIDNADEKKFIIKLFETLYLKDNDKFNEFFGIPKKKSKQMLNEVKKNYEYFFILYTNELITFDAIKEFIDEYIKKIKKD